MFQILLKLVCQYKIPFVLLSLHCCLARKLEWNGDIYYLCMKQVEVQTMGVVTLHLGFSQCVIYISGFYLNLQLGTSFPLLLLSYYTRSMCLSCNSTAIDFGF